MELVLDRAFLGMGASRLNTLGEDSSNWPSLQENNAIKLLTQRGIMSGHDYAKPLLLTEGEKKLKNILGCMLVKVTCGLNRQGELKGYWPRARAIAARCCWPRRAVKVRWWNRWSRPTRWRRSLARAVATERGFSAISWGISTFSSAVNSFKRWWNW